MELSNKIVVDLGTVNCIYSPLNSNKFSIEPTVVAVEEKSGKVLAVGDQAKNMLGRTPSNIIPMRPLKEGVIANYKVTQTFIKYIINDCLGKIRWLRPDIMLSAPIDITSIEKAALIDAAIGAGAKRAFLFPGPLAAALGAGVSVGEASGSMVISIGGGISEVAIISLGSVVLSKTIKFAGNSINEEIITYIKNKYNLLIGEPTAEAIKLCGEAVCEVKGRSLVSCVPAVVKIKQDEIFLAAVPILRKISFEIASILESVPPELASDILDKGAVLTGGSADLIGIDSFLTSQLGLPVHKADGGVYCVARGLKIAFSSLDRFEMNLISSR